MKKELLNVKEISEYLNINEKKVYALAKAKKIPCTRVTGKWLFPKKLIDEWLISSAKGNIETLPGPKRLLQNIVFHGSNDVLIEILAHKLKKQFPDFSLSISNVGSIAGLISLKNGICHISGIHLFDPDSKTYNSSYIDKFLNNMEVVAVHLAARRQGLMAAAGNPHNITSITDLANPDIAYVNRQADSGTRTLFDYELKRANISAADINGYEKEVFTHLGVAMEIFSGCADAGMGIYSAAHSLKLDFIPISEENYDLVIPKAIFFTPEIQALLKIIRSAGFREKAQHLGGYDLAQAGEIMSNPNERRGFVSDSKTKQASFYSEHN